MSLTSHRLFVACPLPTEVAEHVADFARLELGHLNLRIIPAEDLRVSLLFYAKASGELRKTLTDLMNDVYWEPVSVKLGELKDFGKGAIGISLDLEEDVDTELKFRTGLMGRIFSVCSDSDYRDKLQSAVIAIDATRSLPFSQMAQELSSSEMEVWSRRNRHQRSWPLHVTIARYGRETRVSADFTSIQTPKIEFALGEIALYESELSLKGATHHRIAQGLPIN